MNTKTIIIGLGIVALVIIGGIFLLSGKKSPQLNQPIQQKSNVQNQSINPTAIPVPEGTLFVTSDGIAPNKISVKLGKPLIIVNNTDTEATIQISGVFSKDIIVQAHKTIKTEVLNKIGEAKAWLSDNKDNVITININ